MPKNEIVMFTGGDLSIEMPVSPDQDTVWLTQGQMSKLLTQKDHQLHTKLLTSSKIMNRIVILLSKYSTEVPKLQDRQCITIWMLSFLLAAGLSRKGGIAFRK